MKKNWILILSFLILAIYFVNFIPLVMGESVTFFDANYGGTTYHISSLHPLEVSGEASAVGQVFTSLESGYLNSVAFYVTDIQGSPYGDLTAYLMGVSVNVPNATVYSVSEIYKIENIVEKQWFYLEFDGTYELMSGEVYSVMVACTNASGVDSINELRFSLGAGVSGTNSFKYHTGGWYPWSYDLAVKVLGDTVPEATPAPTPSPSPSPSPVVTQNVGSSDVFVPVPSYYMILLVLFAVVVVLAGLYVTFEREQENKGVALLFVLVGLVLFVILIVGYLVGF